MRMYKGKMTCFYNGENLWDREIEHFEDVYLHYYNDEIERDDWEVVIVLPGVEVIPDLAFVDCGRLKTVIMSDSVRRIERQAFEYCRSLEFVKLSRNLEYIGKWAFCCCESLTSIFIPPSCREIDRCAFSGCKKLIIFHVPQTTELGGNVIARTLLIQTSHFEADELQLDTSGDYQNSEEVNAWIKNINSQDEEYALHRACSSFNPMADIIYEIVKRKGLASFQKKNEIGITPLKYLEENPFAHVDQQKLVKRYILALMGEAA